MIHIIFNFICTAVLCTNIVQGSLKITDIFKQSTDIEPMGISYDSWTVSYSLRCTSLCSLDERCHAFTLSSLDNGQKLCELYTCFEANNKSLKVGYNTHVKGNICVFFNNISNSIQFFFYHYCKHC